MPTEKGLGTSNAYHIRSSDSGHSEPLDEVICFQCSGHLSWACPRSLQALQVFQLMKDATQQLSVYIRNALCLHKNHAMCEWTSGIWLTQEHHPVRDLDQGVNESCTLRTNLLCLHPPSTLSRGILPSNDVCGLTYMTRSLVQV
eukprot:3680777-Amphidinium_carterae.1